MWLAQSASIEEEEAGAMGLVQFWQTWNAANGEHCAVPNGSAGCQEIGLVRRHLFSHIFDGNKIALWDKLMAVDRLRTLADVIGCNLCHAQEFLDYVVHCNLLWIYRTVKIAQCGSGCWWNVRASVNTDYYRLHIRKASGEVASKEAREIILNMSEQEVKQWFGYPCNHSSRRSLSASALISSKKD